MLILALVLILIIIICFIAKAILNDALAKMGGFMGYVGYKYTPSGNKVKCNNSFNDKKEKDKCYMGLQDIQKKN